MEKFVREFNRAGPCITLGKLIKETAHFYFFDGGMYGKGKIRKETPEHWSRAHVEPCPSCRDHAKTQYPHGYMD